MSPSDHPLLPVLTRIAEALERLSPATPPPPSPCSMDMADSFLWHADDRWLEPITTLNHIEVSLLKGIEHQCQTLTENTHRFVRGLPAHNALLWGARGTGKSSLVKAVHAALNEQSPHSLALVEIHREDIASLPRLLRFLKEHGRPTILFCDDLSFSGQDDRYKSLKAVLDGGIQGRPRNVIFYATSNRRHLLAREMIENEQSTAIHGGETVEEKVSLSDRFGLWLGFHPIDQRTFFDIVRGYCTHYDVIISQDDLQREANAWARTRGAQSGRVAWQFFQDLAARRSIKIHP